MQPAPRTARILSYIFSFFFNHFTVWNATRENDIYIYIRIRRSSISKFSRGRERCGEKRCDCFTSTTRRSTHFDSGSISGSTRRGGWFDRSIEDGWILGRDPPRRNSCRGSSDSGGPRRAEWSELSSAIFSLEPSPRTPLLTRSPRSKRTSHGVSSFR